MFIQKIIIKCKQFKKDDFVKITFDNDTKKIKVMENDADGFGIIKFYKNLQKYPNIIDKVEHGENIYEWLYIGDNYDDYVSKVVIEIGEDIGYSLLIH
jgi:hypothetical protein